MLVSPIGLAALKAREGVRLTAYLDSVGVWTIGYGSTKGVKPGMTITAARAAELLERDIDEHAAPILAAVKVPLEDHERDALVSIAFNIGVAGFKGSTFLKRLNAGDRRGCATAIMSWTKPPEITSRRRAERDQFLTPYSVALPKARADDASPVRSPAATGYKPLTPVKPPATLGGAPLVDYSHFQKGVVYPRLKEAQRLARDKGYADIGNLDGKWGSLSRNTLNAFRADNGMDPDPTGALIENTIAALKASLDKVLPPERSQATVAEVEPKSPIIQQTQKASWWAKLTGWLGSGGMVALGVKDVMPVTLAGFAPYKEYLPAIPPWFWLLLALVVAAVITIGTIIATRKNANVSEIKTEEYRTGGRA